MVFKTKVVVKKNIYIRNPVPIKFSCFDLKKEKVRTLRGLQGVPLHNRDGRFPFRQNVFTPFLSVCLIIKSYERVI